MNRASANNYAWIQVTPKEIVSIFFFFSRFALYGCASDLQVRIIFLAADEVRIFLV